MGPEADRRQPNPAQVVLTVGNLFGLHDGDNPHRWYDPAEVKGVANTIAADLSKLDPKHATYYQRQLQTFETTGLAALPRPDRADQARYAGTPVGASESIFALQAPALGLDLITPASFMKAISEGTEVSAQDTITAAADRQTPDQGLGLQLPERDARDPAPERARARQPHPDRHRDRDAVARRTTRSSSGRWRQLEGIERALHEATGR